MRMRKRVELAEGLEFLEKGINKLRRKLEGYPDSKITVVDKILLYTYVRLCYLIAPPRFRKFNDVGLFVHRSKVYDMCTPPHDYSKELYYKYKEWMVEYMNSTVSNDSPVCVF